MLSFHAEYKYVYYIYLYMYILYIYIYLYVYKLMSTMLKCTNTSTIKEGYIPFDELPLPKQAHYHLDARIEPYTKEDWAPQVVGFSEIFSL